MQQRGGLVADHPASVATTWSLSFQRVEEKDPAAAELLRLCAYLAPDAIDKGIFTRGALFLGPVLSSVAADAFRLNQAIEALRAWMLLFVDYIAAKHIIAPALNTLVGGPSKVYESSRAQISGAIHALVSRAIKSKRVVATMARRQMTSDNGK